MPTRNELQQLARMRISEAEALHKAGLYAGSYYLVGYAVEVALKACVCRLLNLNEYPERELDRNPFKTHKWPDLILFSGLREELHTLLLDPDFKANWDIACSWNPEQRYQTGRTSADAMDLLNAVRSEPKGVLAWLSSQW
jgi:hypothetical protein